MTRVYIVDLLSYLFEYQKTNQSATKFVKKLLEDSNVPASNAGDERSQGEQVER